MVVSYLMGDRSPESAHAFVYDLQDRIDSRIQLTSDGFAAYREAVLRAFGEHVDYAMLVKQYG